MKNNWKEGFKTLFNSHMEDERYAELYYDFIEYLLAEQKKELIEEILKHKLIVGQDFDGKQIYGVYVNDIESLKNHD